MANDESPTKDIHTSEDGRLSPKKNIPKDTHPDAPPVNSPDEGMGTHREDGSQKSAAIKEDGGMTAGYPS